MQGIGYFCFGYMYEVYDQLSDAIEHCRTFQENDDGRPVRTACVEIDFIRKVARIVYLFDPRYDRSRPIYSLDRPCPPSRPLFAYLSKRTFYDIETGEVSDLQEEGVIIEDKLSTILKMGLPQPLGPPPRAPKPPPGLFQASRRRETRRPQPLGCLLWFIPFWR